MPNGISPLPPPNIATAKRTFGVQKETKNLRRTRVILSGKAWEWWWWESVEGKNKRRTRYGGMFHKLSEERKIQYEHNRTVYWSRKIATAARRERKAHDLERSA